jgi:AcrR family transcriptional regulator
MGRREENKERTRRMIVQASLELFRTRGFDETRVQDIVERVGVSPATFFNYFPSKEAVVQAQARAATDMYAALLRHELDRTEATVPERLLQITRVIGEANARDVEGARLVVTRGQLFYGGDADKDAQDHAVFRLITDLFAQGQQRGEIDADAEPEQLAELYTATIMLTLSNWLTGWLGTRPQPLTDRLVAALDVLLWGMAKPTTRPDVTPADTP